MPGTKPATVQESELDEAIQNNNILMLEEETNDMPSIAVKK